MSKKNSSEKKFGTSLFGYNKVDVNLYLESLIKSYNDNLWEKDSQINELKKKSEELQQKSKALSDELNSIEETKESIANTFIEAQRNSSKIMDKARESAAMEKNKLEVESESLRELIIDKKMALKELRDAARSFGTDLESKMTEYINEFSKKVDSVVKESEDMHLSQHIADLPEEVNDTAAYSDDNQNDYSTEDKEVNDLEDNEKSSEVNTEEDENQYYG